MLILKKWARIMVIPVSLALLVFFLMKAVFFIGYVPTESMEPTLKAGSYIFGMRNARTLEVGDIIVFRHGELLLVKRIAGRPGDVIDRSELTYMKTVAIPVWEDPILTVPADSYFVLGDNTDNSVDSRYWEDPFVKQEQVVARLFIQ